MSTSEWHGLVRGAMVAGILGSGCGYSVKDCDGELLISKDECGDSKTGAGADDIKTSEAIPGLSEPECCSDNEGYYTWGYGFETYTYSCQKDPGPVVWPFQLVSDTTGESATYWSKALDITITDAMGMVVSVADDFMASGADFDLSMVSTALDPLEVPAGSGLPYATEDSKQVIVMVAGVLEEGLDVIAGTECYPDGCENYECDIIVSRTIEDSSGEHTDVRYTLSADADEGVYSLRYVLAHEWGHALGLNHPVGDIEGETDGDIPFGDIEGETDGDIPFLGGTIMFPTLADARAADGSISYTGLGSTDIEALRFLYGKR